MIDVCIFVEGVTEQEFLNTLMFSALHERNIFLEIINMKGIKKYSQIKKQIEIACRKNPKTHFTTMFDLFRLPKNFPEYHQTISIRDSFKRVQYLEAAMNKDVAFGNFFANITIHEFEGLLFSDAKQFIKCCHDSKLVANLVKIRSEFSSPEHINGGAKTAPSKRILQIYPKYDKRIHGSLIARAIGLEKILEECLHFRTWFERLSKLNQESTTTAEVLETIALN